MELFEQIRREYEFGVGAVSGVARKLGGRMMRQALANAQSPERKRAQREKRVLGPLMPWIDQLLEVDQKAPRKQRHTAHRIWTRLQVEWPEHTIAESTVRQYVRAKVYTNSRWLTEIADIEEGKEREWASAQTSPALLPCLPMYHLGLKSQSSWIVNPGALITHRTFVTAKNRFTKPFNFTNIICLPENGRAVYEEKSLVLQRRHLSEGQLPTKVQPERTGKGQDGKQFRNYSKLKSRQN